MHAFVASLFPSLLQSPSVVPLQLRGSWRHPERTLSYLCCHICVVSSAKGNAGAFCATFRGESTLVVSTSLSCTWWYDGHVDVKCLKNSDFQRENFKLVFILQMLYSLNKTISKLPEKKLF